MATAALSISAAAADFTGSFGKDLNGNGKISVVDNADGKTVKVTISGATIKVGTTSAPVSDLVLDGVKSSKVGKFQLLNGKAHAGDYDVFFLGQVADGKITAKFNLNLNGAYYAQGTFGETRYTLGQLLGSDFESWHKAEYSGKTSDEPDGWHSFMSANASSIYAAARKNTHTFISKDVRPGAKGQCVKVVSSTVIGVPANGTITTGRLYAGSTTATNTKNNATSDPAGTDKDSNNDPFYAPINTLPDSIAVWVKYKQGALSADNKKNYPYANLSAVLTDGTKYQDPEDKTYTNVLAKAQNKKIEENGNVWQRISVPFTYTDAKLDPKAMLVTLSTNAQPGVASNKADVPDELYIDDLVLVYNSQLSSLKIDGVEVPGFASDKYSYTVYSSKDADKKLEYTTNAKSAFVASEAVAPTDGSGNCVYNVTVTSADLQTSHTYVVNVVCPTTYTDQLLISLDGENQEPEQASIDVCSEGNNNYTFVLKKFSFGEILIGDVTISGVPCVEKNGRQTFTVEKDATITNGAEIAEMLGNKVHVTMNAEIEDGKLYAEMALPVTLGEETINVKATFGKKAANVEKTTYKDQLVISLDGEKQDPEEATIDVIKQSEGKYTFVLNQFSFGSLLIGDVTITDVPGVEKNGYVFYTVEKDAVITNGAEIAEALGNKVHVKIVEAYSKDGKLYAKMTLPVTIEDATMNVEAVFGEKPAAGINGITTTQNGKVEVYNVNGVRLNGLQKGLNIVRSADGKVKKVLVK